jgi:hypothetical protein
LPDVQGVFDDVDGCFESVDFLQCGLQAAGGCSVLAVFEDGSGCAAQTSDVQLSSWDDDAGAVSFDACRYAGLVVAEGDGYERDALGERLEHGVEAGVGDDGGGSFEELELWSVADDKGISQEGSETGGTESATAEGEDELNAEAGACFGDGSEDVLGAVLEGAERGVDEWAAIEATPGKRYGRPLLIVDEGAGVVEVRRPGGGGELECLG